LVAIPVKHLHPPTAYVATVTDKRTTDEKPIGGRVIADSAGVIDRAARVAPVDAHQAWIDLMVVMVGVDLGSSDSHYGNGCQ
jgi:hypothetical protein